jgi:hypothetical protein
MDRMASHISHVAFSSASDAFVDGAAQDSGERIGVEGVEEDGDEEGSWSRDGLDSEVECVGELVRKIDGS